MHEIMVASLNGIVPDSGAKIQFVNSGLSYNGEVPVCEVKMKEKGVAKKIIRVWDKKGVRSGLGMGCSSQTA